MESDVQVLSIRKLKALDIYALYQDFSNAANNYHFGNNSKNLTYFREAQRTLRVLGSRGDYYLKNKVDGKLHSEYDELTAKAKEFLNAPPVQDEHYVELLDDISKGYDKFVNIALVVDHE